MARKLNLGINNVAQTVTAGHAKVDDKTPRKALAFYIGIGGKAQLCYGATPISFTIDGKRYVYEKGTTWEAWVAQNPLYAVTEDGYVSLDGGTTIIYRDDTVKVLAKDEIEHGVVYENNCACREWTEWTTTKYPTCVEDGEEQRTCLACGALQTRAIPAAEEYHNYVYTGGQSSTCISQGYSRYKCSHCEDIKTTWHGTSGHSYNDKGVCTVCNHCKHSLTEHRAKDSSIHEVYCTQCGEVLSTAPHVFDSDGGRTCGYCGYTKPSSGGGSGDSSGEGSDIHTHVWVEAYTKGGLTVYACEGCSETKQVCNHSYDAEGNCIYCSNPNPY